MEENRIERLIWIYFAAIGTLFLIIGIFICTNQFNYKDKINTTAIITDISSYKDFDGKKEHRVYVKYNVNEKEYESELNGYASNFYEGKEINIYYDKNNPKKIGMKSLNFVFLIFPGLGLIFAGIGYTGILRRVAKKRNENNLKLDGEPINASYVETITNKFYSVNGRHPYRIICEWINPDDGEKYIFKSNNLWVNPENIIKEKNISNFIVYIDMNNKKKYVIDIDTLKEETDDLR